MNDPTSIGSKKSYPSNKSRRKFTRCKPLPNICYFSSWLVFISLILLRPVTFSSATARQPGLSTDIHMIKAFVQKYGKHTVIDVIRELRGGAITLHHKDKYVNSIGRRPAESYVTPKSIAHDIQKIGISLNEFEKLLKDTYKKSSGIGRQTLTVDFRPKKSFFEGS